MLDNDSQKKVHDCYKFNMKTQEISKIASIKRPRSAFGIVYIRNYIYVFGGDEKIYQTERYNMLNDTWEDFGKPWPYHLVAVTGSKLKDRSSQ
jgi:Kelch motif